MEPGDASDPEYVSKLVESTKVQNPIRVEIHFQTGLKLLIVEGKTATVRLEPQAPQNPSDLTEEGDAMIAWLIEYRREHSISIQELAKRIGFSVGSLKAYFSLRRAPGEIILGKIRKFKNTLK